MNKAERVIAGCGNCDSWTSVCRVTFDKTAQIQPTLAKETLIDPPGAIEGPPSPGVKGLVCTVARDQKAQESCSHFVVRTTDDDLRDENI
ncbi:MAG: hypothetical protein QXY90_05970 [Candidatus Anstonellales archaeon]